MNDLIEEVDETQPDNTIQLKDRRLQGSNTKQSDINTEANLNEISEEEEKQFELSLFKNEEKNENRENKRRDKYLSNLEDLKHSHLEPIIIETINFRVMQKCTNLKNIYLYSRQIKELQLDTFQQS